MKKFTLLVLALMLVAGPVFRAEAIVDETKRVGTRTTNIAICPTDSGESYTYLIEAYNLSDALVFSLTPAGVLTLAGAINLTAGFGVTDADGEALMTLTGYEASAASLLLQADQSDDSGDDFKISATASDTLVFQNDTSGTQVTKLTLSAAGVLTLVDSETITDASDVITFAWDDAAAEIRIKAFEDGASTLTFQADESDDNGDDWQIQNQADNEFVVLNDTSGSQVEKLKITTAGAVSVPSGSLDVDGACNLGDTTAGADLALGNSTGNITMLSDNADLTCTDGSDNAFQIIIAGGDTVFDLDTGTTNQLNIGGGSTKFSLASDTIDISNAGAVTGATGISTSGTLASTGSFDVDGAANISDTTAGSDVAIGNSTGNITMLSDNADLTCTDGSDNVFQILIAGGNPVIDLDLGTTNTLNIGDGAVKFSLASDALDIDTSGNISGAGTIGCGKITSSYLSTGGPVYASSGILTSETYAAVARGGTGLGSGTSGGVLAYTATGTLASSGLLAQYAPVLGGGAGAVPATITAGTDGQLLLGVTGAACAFGTMSSDATISNAGALTIANNAVALTTDTTGNYVATVVAGYGITVAEADSEGATKTVTATLGVSIESTELGDSQDFGDFSTDASGVATLDADVVAAAEMADADHGDISWSSGVASVDADSVALTTDTTGNYVGTVSAGTGITVTGADGEGATKTVASTLGVSIEAIEIADSQDFGDISSDASGTITLDADVVAAAEMADADHGDISWSSGVASVDADAVALTTDTTGNYVATVAAGTGIMIAEADGEGATKTVTATLGVSIEATELGDSQDYGDWSTDANGVAVVKDNSHAHTTALSITDTGGFQFKGLYDANAYFTINQADGAAVTFDSISDGTPGFTFMDLVGCSGGLQASNTFKVLTSSGDPTITLSPGNVDSGTIYADDDDGDKTVVTSPTGILLNPTGITTEVMGTLDVSSKIYSGASNYIVVLSGDATNQQYIQGGTYTVGGGGTVEVDIPIDLGTVYYPTLGPGTANHDYISACNGATMEITGTAMDTGYWMVLGY